MDKIEFSIYKLVSDFFNNPLETLSSVYTLLIDKGYFNFKHLYQQFYDKGVGFPEVVHYETILKYIIVCIIIYFLNKFIFKINLLEKNLFKIFLPIHVTKLKSFKIDIFWFILTTLKFPALFINITMSAFFLHSSHYWIANSDLSSNPVSEFFIKTFQHFPNYSYETFVFLVAFLVYDFFAWFGHYLLHKNKFLWCFHKVHHYPKQLTLLAGVRHHPIDGFFLGVLPTLMMAFSIGILTTYSLDYSSPSSLLENNNVFYILLISLPSLLSFLNHSGLPVTYGRFLGKVFISPMAHMIHHSSIVINKNMGSTLSVWDVIFKTYHEAKDTKEYLNHYNNIGLPNVSDNYYSNIFSLFLYPFQEAFVIFYKSISNVLKNIYFKFCKST